MSEFKFACPVCGQHMAADTGTTGTHIECPTCFQEIIVPKPPAGATRYILSATQPIKSRPVAPPAPLPPQPGIAALRSPIVGRTIAAAIVVALLAGAGLATLYWREQTTFKRASQPNQRAEPSSLWNLDLARSHFPQRTAYGKIHDIQFVCDRAVLQGGSLTLRRGRSGPTDLAITVFLFARRAEDLAGKSINVSTNDPGAPRVLVVWNENDQLLTQMFMRGYALKLEFGELTATGMPGMIHLSLPDDSKSWVAGKFKADIQAGGTRRSPSSR